MRSALMIVVALVFSSACAKKPVLHTPQPPVRAAVPPLPKPPLNAPFQWAIQVQASGSVATYRPGRKAQRIPMLGSSWECAQMGLSRPKVEDGTYVEARDVVCKLDGKAVGGRTLCSRDTDGKASPDTQVLVVDDGTLTATIIIQCVEGRTDEEPDETPPQPGTTSRPANPFFEQPKTIDL